MLLLVRPRELENCYCANNQLLHFFVPLENQTDAMLQNCFGQRQEKMEIESVLRNDKFGASAGGWWHRRACRMKARRLRVRWATAYGIWRLRTYGFLRELGRVWATCAWQGRKRSGRRNYADPVFLHSAHPGRELGSGTSLIRMAQELVAGNLPVCAFDAESCMNRSRGHCMTMGTASTMASMVETLGMSLPENAAIPAVDARRYTLAQLTGRRIVDMGPRGFPTARSDVNPRGGRT